MGIEIDSVQMKLQLPEDKLERVKMLVAEWRGRRSYKKRELESLIGHLFHACKVVRPGRRFSVQYYVETAHPCTVQSH